MASTSEHQKSQLYTSSVRDADACALIGDYVIESHTVKELYTSRVISLIYMCVKVTVNAHA